MKTIAFAFAALMATVACSPVSPPDENNAGTGTDPAASTALTVTAWGPQTTTVGVPVNAFPDGHSGISFTLSRKFEGYGTDVLLEGKSLPGVAFSENVITAMLPPSDIATEGSKRIVIKLASGQLIEVGDFVVTSTAAKANEVDAVIPSAQDTKQVPATEAGSGPVDGSKN